MGPNRPAGDRRRMFDWVLLAAATVWSAALLVVAMTAPLYETTSVDATTSSAGVGHVTQSSTLIAENGSGVMLIMGIPLLVTIIVAVALWTRGSRPGAGPVAWTLTCLLCVFNLLAMLTIGLFVIPVTACLIVVCSRRQAVIGHGTGFPG